jgi:hypothetical protein
MWATTLAYKRIKTMVEQTLEVQTVNKGGKVYKNLNLKANAKKGTKGIDPGNYIIVEKVYAEGKKFESPTLQDAKGNPVVSYSCQVKYNGEDASFWLNPKEHASYATCGGIGDKVKISLTREEKTNRMTGAEMLVKVLSFEKVE